MATAREDQSLRMYAGWSVGMTLTEPKSESVYSIDPRHLEIPVTPVRHHKGVPPNATITLGRTIWISLARSVAPAWTCGATCLSRNLTKLALTSFLAFGMKRLMSLLAGRSRQTLVMKHSERVMPASPNIRLSSWPEAPWKG